MRFNFYYIGSAIERKQRETNVTVKGNGQHRNSNSYVPVELEPSEKARNKKEKYVNNHYQRQNYWHVTQCFANV